MKNLILLSLCCLFSLNLCIAQTSSPSRTIIKGTSATIDLLGTQTQAEVEAIDALLIINHLGHNAIEEIEVITGAYDAKYRPMVKRLRPRAGSGIIAHFRVVGHPKGAYSIFFRPVNRPNTLEGRQKNRRVEVKIVFE